MLPDARIFSYNHCYNALFRHGQVPLQTAIRVTPYCPMGLGAVLGIWLG